MESNKRILVILIFLIGVTQACNRKPTPTPEITSTSLAVNQNGNTPTPEITNGIIPSTPTAVVDDLLPQDFVQPSIPGLYLPYGTRLEGDFQRAVISSKLSCAHLFSVLEGGEWRMTRRVTLSGMGDPLYLALLERGETLLSVRASPSSRTFPSASTGTATATPETPSISTTTSSEYCVAVVQEVSRRSLHAQGQVTLAGEALQFPFCSITEGKASLNLNYQSPDNMLTMLKIIFPAQIGDNNLDAEVELSLDVLQDMPGLFDWYAVLAAFMANPEAEQPKITSWNFHPGQDFSGKVTLTSLKPLIGNLLLNGLVTEDSDAPQSFEASFACTPPDGLPKDMVDLRPIERPEVSLSLDMHYEISTADKMGFTQTADVHMAGVLKADSPDTYVGQWLATGQGSFSSYDSNFKTCTNTWSGSQLLNLAGHLAGSSKLVLDFTPAELPQVEFENTCGVDSFDAGFLPTDNVQLKARGSLDLAWPPDTEENANQTIDGHMPDIGTADFGTWQVVFQN